MRLYQLATMVMMIFSLQHSIWKSAIVAIRKRWLEKKQKDLSRPKNIMLDQI